MIDRSPSLWFKRCDGPVIPHLWLLHEPMTRDIHRSTLHILRQLETQFIKVILGKKKIKIIIMIMMIIKKKLTGKKSPAYLSNRPQVSMVYQLINHAGCWQNTRRIGKPRAAGEWFTNSSSVLPTSQVVYQPLTHRKLVVYCFCIIIQKTRDFSVGLPAQ